MEQGLAQPPQEPQEGEIEVSENLPPLTKRDIAGLVVAILGTIALILLAVTTADSDSGDIGGLAAARLLIATFVTLINLAHIVGIFLFESVNYHGVFERFFSKMSLIGTPIALVISLLLGLVLD